MQAHNHHQNLKILQQQTSSGVDVPSWAYSTLPAQTHKTQHQHQKKAAPLKLNPWQKAWRPFHELINPTMIEPEQYSAHSYAFYNTAYSSQFQPFPKIVSTSGNFATLPVQYSAAQYSFMNPVMNHLNHPCEPPVVSARRDCF